MSPCHESWFTAHNNYYVWATCFSNRTRTLYHGLQTQQCSFYDKRRWMNLAIQYYKISIKWYNEMFSSLLGFTKITLCRMISWSNKVRLAGWKNMGLSFHSMRLVVIWTGRHGCFQKCAINHFTKGAIKNSQTYKLEYLVLCVLSIAKHFYYFWAA